MRRSPSGSAIFWRVCNPPPAGMVVAVSGGADSVALLRGLADVFAGRLVVAHFDHGLRGSESEADAAFVRELAAQLRLTCVVERWHRQPANEKNLEAAARSARYTWLAKVARNEKLRVVATGHTASDQAETVLFHLLRGTGLTGLRGIARRRKLDGNLELIRPLLDAGRSDVERYLKALDQRWRDDSSNVNRRFARNRIRHDLLPLLARDFNPRVAQALARLGREAQSWRRAQLSGIARALRAAELPKPATPSCFPVRSSKNSCTIHCDRFGARFGSAKVGR